MQGGWDSYSSPWGQGGPTGPQVVSSFGRGCQNYLQVKEIKLHSMGDRGRVTRMGIRLMAHSRTQTATVGGVGWWPG